jgi:hypothetical protein
VSWFSCTNLRPRRPPPPHRAFDRPRMHSLKSRGGHVWALGGVHLHKRQRRQQPNFRGDGSRCLQITNIPAHSPHHPLYLNTVALLCMQRPRQREGGKRTRRYIRTGWQGSCCIRLIPPPSLRLRTARRWWTPPAKTARGARATPLAPCCMVPSLQQQRTCDESVSQQGQQATAQVRRPSSRKGVHLGSPSGGCRGAGRARRRCGPGHGHWDEAIEPSRWQSPPPAQRRTIQRRRTSAHGAGCVCAGWDATARPLRGDATNPVRRCPGGHREVRAEDAVGHASRGPW